MALVIQARPASRLVYSIHRSLEADSLLLWALVQKLY